jgi:hypothetical protein
MAFQYSTSIRNAALDVVETTIGTAPTLTLRSGAAPATADAAATGTIIATIVLPSDWMAAASSGSKSIAGGPWTDLTADNAGTIAHFRIAGSGGTMQGTATLSGGGGDMTLDAVVVNAGQQINITGFTLNIVA